MERALSEIKKLAMQKKSRRMNNAINAGSMADIAFLLLIFFLVTTVIMNEKGIMVKLPPMYDGPIPPIPEKNVINIKINGEGQLLFEKQPLEISQLKEEVKNYILNPQGRADLPTHPRNAVVSLQNDRATPYESYLGVYDQLKAAYSELWNEAALAQHQQNFELLAPALQKEIKAQIPQFISEADPTDF